MTRHHFGFALALLLVFCCGLYVPWVRQIGHSEFVPFGLACALYGLWGGVRAFVRCGGD